MGENKQFSTELVIIGAGIAGVTASVYAKRAGVDFVLVEPKAIGGQLLFIEDVDNYVGLLTIKGRDLSQKLADTLHNLEIKFLQDEVKKIEIKDNYAVIYTPNINYKVKGVILATGASFKKLEVPGEIEFTGKGVSYCAICDGFFFRGKDVAVVGGGNSAVEEALYLSGMCRKVYLIHRRNKLRATEYLQKEIFEKKNIEVIFNNVIKEIQGKEIVEKVIVENTESHAVSSFNINGLFVAIGTNPNTEIFKGIIKMDEGGFIFTDEGMKTSCHFIWACGDCRRRPLRQLITAASDGAIAAVSAYKYLKGYYISS